MPLTDPDADAGVDAAADRREIRWDRLRESIAGVSGPAPSDHEHGPRHAIRDDLSGLVRAVLIVVVVAAAIAGVLFWRAWPRQIESIPSASAALGAPDSPVAHGSPGASGAAPSSPLISSAPEVVPAMVVHVVGRVRRPGVVRLPAGSRVGDAIKAAGGLRPGTNQSVVNLARPLSDGEQLVVALPTNASGSTQGTSGGVGATTTGTTSAGSAVIDLNRATAEQLEQLDGIGPVLAGRIVEYRDRQGRFSRVDELREVSGIGPKIFAALSNQVRV